MPFAGEAYMACPLTHDKHAFRECLDAVNTDIVPTKGTDLAAAIAEARRAMKEGAHHKILVLITDGEDLEERGVAEAEKAAAGGGVARDRPSVRRRRAGAGRAEGLGASASPGNRSLAGRPRQLQRGDRRLQGRQLRRSRPPSARVLRRDRTGAARSRVVRARK